jgi:hypothetical protein
MPNEMFTSIDQQFKYLLTYKFSQDHIELLLSCIRAKGGCSNKPKLSTTEVCHQEDSAQKCSDSFKECERPNLFKLFHIHNSIFPLQKTQSPFERSYIWRLPPTRWDRTWRKPTSNTFEWLHNMRVPFECPVYIGGYIVSNLVKELSCSSCKCCLVSHFPIPTPDHDYCAMKYSEVASAFTLFVNNGGFHLNICWFHFNLLFHTVVEVAEKVFKAKMIMRRWLWTCAVILSWNPVFDSHEQGVKKNVFEEDHRASLIKLTADRYLTLRLCTYCKRFNNTVVDG